jgi:hypothetical protein
VARGVEGRRRVALLVLSISGVFALSAWGAHLCSEVLRLRYVIACGFVERTVSSVFVSECGTLLLGGAEGGFQAR